MTRRAIRFLLVGVAAGGLFAPAAAAQESRPALVGARTRIAQIVLPGPELAAKPVDAKSPLVVRIAATFPHGTDFRYDLEFEGLEPGGYDLREWLQRKDGTPAVGLPPVLGVEIRSAAPAGLIVPHAPAPAAAPEVGGYRRTLYVLGAAWALAGVALVLVGRRRRVVAAAEAAPRSLADVLRPLVEAAAKGDLAGPDRARLELGLTALWRRRLGWESSPPDELYARLRAHPEAGPLLQGLERWLHAPEAGAGVDVGALLAPYRALKASDWEASGT